MSIPVLGAWEEDTFKQAVDALRKGFVIAIPTDTVYGLVAVAGNDDATARLFTIKDRPQDVNVQVLTNDTDSAKRLVSSFPPVAAYIARRYWPGAVTMVLRRAPGIDWALGSDSSTIGIRCPDHELARRLCETVGPLAATSANRHGLPNARDAMDLVEMFGDAALAPEFVVDGGEVSDLASTVVDLTDGTLRILREGAVSASSLDKAAAEAAAPES
ncbi:MAG TPA: L-threonylcarbamoyladenylate synthase [Acidimicrobiales bacterium]|nr:L-threonylcarbamoyladenylate synthase [Acidimicrobiales bacterium]